MRIFLDVNILFSAAKSAGAIRQLLGQLNESGHTLVADEYVIAEAQRNLIRKSGSDASDAIIYLETLLQQNEVRHVQHSLHPVTFALTDTDWLPTKGRPVLLAAMALKCHAFVTGDRADFGLGFGKTFGGVTIYSPAQLALEALRP